MRMRRWAVVLTAVLTGAACCSAFADKTPNLVGNPGFEQDIRYDARDWKKGLTVWRFYEITLPAKGARDRSDAAAGKWCFRFTGTGKGFLHSGFFAVKPSQKLRITFCAKGGTPEAQVFWWKKEGVETDKVKLTRVSLKKTKAAKGWTKYTGDVSAPKDARKAYVRFIAKGPLRIDEVSCREVSP